MIHSFVQVYSAETREKIRRMQLLGTSAWRNVEKVRGEEGGRGGGDKRIRMISRVLLKTRGEL